MRPWLFVLIAGWVVLRGDAARADVRLPALVSDGMVLQQGVPLRIWGWAAEGERVTVRLHGQEESAEARGGRWSVTLKPLAAGGPFELTVAGRNQLVVRDVLVGEVWLCSGQSNMEFPLQRASGARADIEAAADPLLRMFTVGKQIAAEPAADVASGSWESATPRTRGEFSAVGFYFGRALRAALGVPVGLIHASWGGTPAEAWMSRAALEQWGMQKDAFAALAPPEPAARQAYERRLMAWREAGRPHGEFDDPGVSDAARAWASPGMADRSWRSMSVPLAWERLGLDMEVDGGVWFRRDVTLPASWAGRELTLSLGAIDDVDTTYFNGVAVGVTGTEVPNHWQAPRRYRVPPSAARAGRVVIAVRVWDHGGDGGFMGPPGAMWLEPAGAGPGERLSLAGDWRFAPERTRPSMPNPPGLDSSVPSVLHSGMIAPLLPYAIQGVAWYQGESNTRRAAEYASLLSTLIRSWRADFRLGDFPFLIVQLAPYMAVDPEPRESDWAVLREAQDRVARETPSAGLVVITDAGDEKDIHPTRKRPVGERLALAARRLAYAEPIVAFGPRFVSAKIAGDRVIVRFESGGKGLKVHGERLTGFAIAGQDERFVNADASLEGDRVIVSSPRVPSPAYVRFGWANYPVVNLYDETGLPAVPFRTDPP